ncbi:MAG TPA: NAD(P)-dependent oxidoreductase [Pyrinomonadaceae bacterium]
MKKVLVTGATGFLGRHCLPALAGRGYEVHAVFRREEARDQVSATVRWHRADLLNRHEVFELVEQVRPTHLLHLAWYAEPGKYWTSTENFRWVQASLDLFQAFAEAGGRRVVCAGTCAEYEWGGREAYVEGETPLKPATVYGACKHALRVMLEAYAAQSGLSAGWGRIFFLYGPHEHPDRLVAYVIRSLLGGEPARCSHGRQVRDFLHVEDVAEAFVALLESDAAGAVNIASGSPVALKEIILELGRLTGRSELIRLDAVPAPASEPPAIVADVERLSDEVGWRPRFDLSEGLARTVRWWQQRLKAEG